MSSHHLKDPIKQLKSSFRPLSPAGARPSSSSGVKGKRKAQVPDSEEDDDDEDYVQVMASGASNSKGRVGEAAAAATPRAPPPRVFSVQWRNPTSKVHKTWESDGYVIVKGQAATLRDSNGKHLASGTVAIQLLAETEFKVGGKECMIEEEEDYDKYAIDHGLTATPAPTNGAFSGIPATAMSRSKPALPTSTLAQKQQLQRSQAAPPVKKFVPPAPSSRPANVERKGSSNSASRHGENAAPAPNKARPTINLLVDGQPARVKARKRSHSFDSSTEAEETSPKLMRTASSTERKTNVVDLTNRSDAMEVEEEGIEEEEEMLIVEDRKGKGKAREMPPPPRASIKLVPSKPVGDAFGLGTQPETRYYACQWRTYNGKKKAAWAGDGVLVIVDKMATLKDAETSKVLTSNKVTSTRFKPGDPLTIKDKIMEIERVMEAEEYTSGRCFLSGAAAAAASKPKAKAAPPDLGNLMAPLKSSTFFINPVIKPPVVSNAIVGKNRVVEARHDPKAEGAVVMARPSDEHQVLFNKKNLPIVDVVVDPILGNCLRPHQKEGVKFMYECVMGIRSEGQGCILADEMGLGKTIQAIALLYTLLKQNPYYGDKVGVIERAIIVCPVTLVKNWGAEFRKWLGRDRIKVFVADQGASIRNFCVGRQYQVLIIGYERLRSVIDEIKGCQPPIGLIICDEGHRLKSSNAKTTQAIQTLSCKRRIILSGTPIQNDLGEFHAMVDFVNPGLLDAYNTFKRTFESVILKARDPKASSKDKAVGNARMDQLNRISQSFMLRRLGDVVAKYLPPKLEYTVFIVPTQFELAIYSQILESQAVANVLSGEGAEQLATLMMLRKLCNTPGLLMQQLKEAKGTNILGGAVEELIKGEERDAHDFTLSGKLLALSSLLVHVRETEEKIVVVSNFTQTLDIIEKTCKKLKYPLCRLDGKTPQADRQGIVDRFNTGSTKDNFIFLLSSKSGGTGLNIIGASRLVLFDSDWNPSTDLQAMARIHREGQKRQCVIYRFLTAGTLDEKIFQRQVTKLGLSGSVMDTNKAGETVEKGDAFTLDDLRDIFKLHAGVASQTHDLLGCQCHLDPEEKAASGQAESDEDEDDDSMLPGFTQASQYVSEPKPKEKGRKNLALLKLWTHHNCTEEASVDEIEDGVLRALVYTRVGEAPEDDDGADPVGRGTMRLRGGQVGFAFAKKGVV